MTTTLDDALCDGLFLRAIGEDTDILLSMVRNSRDCFKLLSADGYLLFLNDYGMKIMEIDERDDVLNSRWPALWPEHQQERVEIAMAKAAQGEAVRFEASCPTAKGREAHWDVVITPVTNVEGEIVQLLAVSRDITARVQLEQQLRQREQEIEQLEEQQRDLRQSA